MDLRGHSARERPPHADRLIEKLGLTRKQTVVMPAIRESRKARKTGEENHGCADTSGKARPPASAGQTAAGGG